MLDIPSLFTMFNVQCTECNVVQYGILQIHWNKIPIIFFFIYSSIKKEREKKKLRLLHFIFVIRSRQLQLHLPVKGNSKFMYITSIVHRMFHAIQLRIFRVKVSYGNKKHFGSVHCAPHKVLLRLIIFSSSLNWWWFRKIMQNRAYE